jgi:type II secretory pathway component PulK
MPPARRNQRGIALLLVLWIFTILGVIALDFARYIRDDAMAAVNLADETRGYYLALAGMNRAIFDAERLREQGTDAEAANKVNGKQPQGLKAKKGFGAQEQQDDDDAPVKVPPDGQWHEDSFAGGRYSVRMTDEGGRISLNRASEATLTRVVTNLVRGGNATTGVDTHAAKDIGSIVDAILDWRDSDDLARANGAESDYYLGLRTPYHAKNGLFDSPEELLLVKGITAALFYGGDGSPGLRDIFSVYSKEQKINVKTAPAAVFQVLLDTDAQTAADLVTLRDGDPDGFLPQIQAQVTAVDPTLALLLVTVEPRIVVIEGRADVSEERNQSRVAAVADLSSDVSEGAKIIRWLDRAPWEGGLPTTGPPQGATS